MNRCLHHHVFDTELAVGVVDHAGFKILAVEPIRPNSIILVGCKPVIAGRPDNAAFFGKTAAFRRTSPFLGDRRRGRPCRDEASSPLGRPTARNAAAP